jgi:hypothetical protein
MDKQYKLIFNSYLARTLLVKYGHNIIDLKKDRNRENGVIFVFEATEQFLKDLETASKE